VVINGVLVIDNGVYTGARPGRALRHGSSGAAEDISRDPP
jgi:N-acyl-D-aspartate/D-glutamate deacylase